MTWKQINRRHLNHDSTHQDAGIALCKPARTRVTRYRYWGMRIPAPWTTTSEPTSPRAQLASLPDELPLERIQQALA
jgi:hypothetical protein